MIDLNPLRANDSERDLFSRLGLALEEAGLTPLRLAELAASEARKRELEFLQAEMVATTFHLVVRDIDVRTFTYDAWFEPPLREGSAEPMSAATTSCPRVWVLRL